MQNLKLTLNIIVSVSSGYSMGTASFEPPRGKTNKMTVRPAKTLIRLGGSAWASAQSDQSFRCPHEESLGPYLPIERTAKTLIRLGGCPG